MNDVLASKSDFFGWSAELSSSCKSSFSWVSICIFGRRRDAFSKAPGTAANPSQLELWKQEKILANTKKISFQFFRKCWGHLVSIFCPIFLLVKKLTLETRQKLCQSCAGFQGGGGGQKEGILINFFSTSNTDCIGFGSLIYRYVPLLQQVEGH